MSLFPPGTVPNYIDPPDHHDQTIALHTVMLTLVTVATAMRVWTRAGVTKNFGLDDCTNSLARHATSS